jgi:hypothetical protein
LTPVLQAGKQTSFAYACSATRDHFLFSLIQGSEVCSSNHCRGKQLMLNQTSPSLVNRTSAVIEVFFRIIRLLTS